MASDGQTITGFRHLSSGKTIVTNDVVNDLRETEGV